MYKHSDVLLLPTFVLVLYDIKLKSKPKHHGQDIFRFAEVCTLHRMEDSVFHDCVMLLDRYMAQSKAGHSASQEGGSNDFLPESKWRATPRKVKESEKERGLPQIFGRLTEACFWTTPFAQRG